jgi:hypothetical protein
MPRRGRCVPAGATQVLPPASHGADDPPEGRRIDDRRGGSSETRSLPEEDTRPGGSDGVHDLRNPCSVSSPRLGRRTCRRDAATFVLDLAIAGLDLQHADRDDHQRSRRRPRRQSQRCGCGDDVRRGPAWRPAAPPLCRRARALARVGSTRRVATPHRLHSRAACVKADDRPRPPLGFINIGDVVRPTDSQSKDAGDTPGPLPLSKLGVSPAHWRAGQSSAASTVRCCFHARCSSPQRWRVW